MRRLTATQGLVLGSMALLALLAVMLLNSPMPAYALAAFIGGAASCAVMRQSTPPVWQGLISAGSGIIFALIVRFALIQFGVDPGGW